MRDVSGTADRIQSRLLQAGAAFDGVFGLAMLLMPVSAARLLRIRLPEDLTYFSLAGLLLVILAGLYVIAAASPSRHRLAAVAGAGRLGGMLLLWKIAAAADHGAAFWVAGLLDGSLGFLHLAVALSHRRASGGWGSV